MTSKETIVIQEGHHELRLPIPKFMLASGEGGSLGDAVAPMPGVIEKVMVTAGTQVEKGDPLVIMIAMKMEVSIGSRRIIEIDCIYSNLKSAS